MKRIKYLFFGGTLQFVIVLSFLIITVCFTFFILTDLKTKISQRNSIKQQAHFQITEDIIASLNTNFSSTKPNVNLIKSFFGLFERYSSTIDVNGINIQKEAFVGGASLPYTLYIANKSNNPIYLAGNASVSGNVSLSKGGVRRGSIGGVSLNSTFHFSNHSLSDFKLPGLSSSFRSHLDNLVDKTFNSSDEVEDENSSIIVRSFKEPTLFIDYSELAIMNEITLIGNIIIFSNNPIFISNSSKLIDVFLIAPSIEIESYTQGQFQALASKNILIGSNAIFSYPSAFWVHTKEIDKNSTFSLLIEENTQINGFLGCTIQRVNSEKKPRLIIENESQVNGFIYSELPVSLEGTIQGGVIAESFIAKVNGKYFLDHLYNGKISEHEFTENYAGFSLKEQSSKKIMKWLY